MTEVSKGTTEETTGAARDRTEETTNWDSIDWTRVEQEVNRLQVRIVQAEKAGKPGRVKALQRLLTRSFSGKALAVARVTSNQGKNTPGVDNQTWHFKRSKEMALAGLTQRGYQPLPLRRVLIPKSNGRKMRPLGIPTIKDRAMQALYLLALDPIAETRADPNSYGFRKARSCADAIEQCFNALAQHDAAEWILEGDIQACFDQINHEWLMEHVPLADKPILHAWLKAGYLYKNAFHNTNEGVPQGGIISPTLANLTLDGLERTLEPWTGPRKGRKAKAKVHLIRYADDFVITGSSQELLENEIRPCVERFLAERGLVLSPEKTRITHIGDGFDFLGQNLRKYGGYGGKPGKLIIKPSKANVQRFRGTVRTVIKGNQADSAYTLIGRLNPKIIGWANYHRHVCSKSTFEQVDHALFRYLWQWANRRHPGKGRRWVARKYFGARENRRWWFFGETHTAREESRTRNWLALAARTRIVRHVKIRKDANPYDPADADYFARRKDPAPRNRRKSSATSNTGIDGRNEDAVIARPSLPPFPKGGDSVAS